MVFDGWQSDERSVLQRMAQKRGLAFVDLERVKAIPKDIALICGETTRQHRIAPIKREGNTLWLAMADTNDEAAIEAAKLATNCRIVPVVALPGALETWIDRHYPLPDADPP